MSDEKKNNKKNKKIQNKKVNFIGSKENLKYISRCFYYGTLKDFEYVNGGLVLKMAVYTATKYTATTTIIRMYVPSDLEEHIIDLLECGSNYWTICAPYKVRGAQNYNYRVDLLLNIFPEFY